MALWYGRSDTDTTTLHCWAVPESVTSVTAETAAESMTTAGVVGSRMGSRRVQQSPRVCWWASVAVSQRVMQPCA